MVLPASCPPTVWWLLWGTIDTESKSSTFLWAGGGHKWRVHKDERNYVHQSFVATHKPGKCAVGTRSYQRPLARKSKPRRSPALWAVVRMTCVLDDVERNQLMWFPLIYQMNSLLIIFVFNIIICCTWNICPRAVEQATQATTRENLSSGFPTKRVSNHSLRLNRGASQGFWGSGENGYLFSGSWGALVIISGDLGSKLIFLGI